ncbi:Aste57867_4891 [Aphanomyces stellatus]|uniref:Aste57867_4891 protein n=1 Tax=Aphanomyces stellatus TaxID=120398 RepID=A0A485KGH3_9STRA|nr:hypothetical protein As57867_004878 [Aphanomyces stellatus]VFT81983.1 Aste57867_4891 [Aphanomyces stellatus]
MGWEGTTGHLYLCGSHEISRGECKKYNFAQGRKVKAVYGNYSSLLALCDGWEFEWLSSQVMGLAKSLNDVRIHQLAFGKTHTAALSLDGHIFVWGDAAYGQLGLGGKVTSAAHPIRLRHSKNVSFSSVACGGYHTAAVSEFGDLYTWGRNFEGQLGHSTKVASLQSNETLNGVFHHPKHVASFLNKKCKQVACGDKFTAVLTVHGEIYTFGEGQAGQLGRGRCTKEFVPSLTLKCDDPSEEFVEIACGWAHTLTVTNTGRLYAWGFNLYGQLGLGDTNTRFFPQEIECIPLTHVYAGGNYSAAICRGRLLTWGNGCHCKLAQKPRDESHVLTPTIVNVLNDTYVQSVACAWDNMLVFAPTWVSLIKPTSGSLEGGTKISIYGSGFWESDDLTVRFVPLTEGRLPRAVLAAYDPASGIVSCEAPKFSVAGDFAVEVAMNGKHFTSNGYVFEVYVPASFTFISHEELPLVCETLIQLHFNGEKPKSTLNPSLRWVPLNSHYLPILVTGDCGSIEVSPKDNQEELPSEPDGPTTPTFMVSFPAPKFVADVNELIPCQLEVSFNGQDYIPVEMQGNVSSMNPQVVYFHRAAVVRCAPNSMPFSDKMMSMQIEVNQLFDIGQIVCKAQYSEPVNTYAKKALVSPNSSRDATYRVATANLTVRALKLGDQIIECTVPPFAEWSVQTITPNIDNSESDDEEKSKKPLVRAQSNKLLWFQQDEQQLEAKILVSLNGGKSFLPTYSPFASTFYGFSHGTLTHTSPTSGPITGGTIVSLSATHLSFDTDNSLVSIEYDGDLQTTSSYVRASRENEGRVVTFQTPSFLSPLQDIPNTPTGSQGQNVPASPLNQATIRLALSGTTFGESSLPFEFYRNPAVRLIEPQVASPGVMLLITGSYLQSSSSMKCKVENETGTFSKDVEVDFREEKAGATYKLEMPQLGTVANGQLLFYVALNGQQYATSEFAKFTYVDEPEMPPGKEDKKKH